MFTVALINDVFGDPALFLEFKYRNQALLFDLGDLHRLTPRQILKIDYIFVSHTHMDHFIGFDYLLRICLGRDKQLKLFGPAGFLQNVTDRLRAYTWNLVNNYTNDFTLEVTEVDPSFQRKQVFSCRQAFRPQGESMIADFTGSLLTTPHFTVRATHLDHGIPTLAFRFEEANRINIKKNCLMEMSLPIGPWLMELKEKILSGAGDDTPIRIWWRDEEKRIREKWGTLGELKEQLVVVKGGQSVCYVTDAVGSTENSEKIIALARGADYLFIEAPFLHEDLDTARRKAHLTARQAGLLAREARVKRMHLFHFSPKYRDKEQALRAEGERAFSGIPELSI